MPFRRGHRPRFASDVVWANDDPWTGPVVRRDPASYQRPSEVRTWLCRRCRTWASGGAWKVGRCNWCGTKRPKG